MNPLSAIFGAGVALRNALYDRRVVAGKETGASGGEHWQYFRWRQRQDAIRDRAGPSCWQNAALPLTFFLGVTGAHPPKLRLSIPMVHPRNSATSLC